MKTDTIIHSILENDLLIAELNTCNKFSSILLHVTQEFLCTYPNISQQTIDSPLTMCDQHRS